jgi:PPE-repeat protein
MDFGTLPPEINSGRMYTGAGSGPMMAAATAWDALASELSSTASSYESVVSGLTSGAWAGPSSASMAAAAAPYVQWMSASAGQAEQTASQAKLAAAAYEAAFAATVPPPVIAANRSLLMSLVATNFLGQNTPAIAATESHYAEMWAQDAAAMYGYAGSSASASQLTPFGEPPQTTNSAGTGAQAASLAQNTGASAGSNAQSSLAQAMASVPSALQSGGGGSSGLGSIGSSLNSALSSFTGSLNPLSLFGIAGTPFLLGIQSVLLPLNGSNVAAALAKSAPAVGAGSVLAGELGAGQAAGAGGSALSAGLGGANLAGASSAASVGNASMVGGLSVPQGWASAAPAIRQVAAVLPNASLTEAAPVAAAEGETGMASQLALSNLAGRAMAGTGGAQAHTVSVGGGAAGTTATNATIIVLPAGDDDE